MELKMEPSTGSLDPQAVALAKAIRQTESQNHPEAKGKSGEYGAYQFMPETWNAYAKEAGVNTPIESATIEQQNQVAYHKIKQWKDAGYNPGQIASMWNAGPGKPNAYIEGNKGVNSQGVEYDTAAYAKKVATYYQQFKAQTGGYAAPGQNGEPAPAQGNNSYAPPPPPPPISDSGQAAGAPEQSGGFIQNEGNSVANRLGQAGNAISQTATGQINPLSGLLQVGGAIGGGISDLAGNALGAITPDFIKKPIEGAAQKVVSGLANTQLGKAAIGGAQDFSQKHPELAADIGAVGDIVGGAGVVTGAGALKDAAGGLIGKALGRDALSGVVADISPEIKAGTKAGAANVAKGGTTKSIFGTIQRAEDPMMRQAAPVVLESVPNFSKLPTYAEKLAAIQNDAIPQEAKLLRQKLASGEIKTILNPDNYKEFVDMINKEIADSPGLIGDSGEYARRFLKIFESKLPQGADAEAINVLDARQALDQEALKYKPKAFDAAKSSAYTDGLFAVRNAANILLDKMAPDAAVKASLRRQSLLYRVAKNLAPKADKEVGSGLIKRAAMRHPHITRALKYTGASVGTGLGIREAQNLLGE